MGDSHCRLLYHLVFGTRDRIQLIAPEMAERLYAYMAGVVKGIGGTPIAIGGTTDHVHLLVELDKNKTVPDAIRDIKTNSSRWVHQTYPQLTGFSWQDGYGAFTVSVRGVEQVKTYIRSQEERHRRVSFRDEYVRFLRDNGIAPEAGVQDEVTPAGR